MPVKKPQEAIEIPSVEMGQIEIALVGDQPYLCHRMSEKARQELLLPKPKTTGRKTGLKHDPIEEFRASYYSLVEEDAPTLLAVMASSVKRAMATAALDLPGSSKSQIGRLVWVDGHLVPLYGSPFLYMNDVKSSDINRTPDIRTWALVHPWVVKVTIGYTRPMLNDQAVLNLLYMAGRTVGIGDWRPEKGKGTFGQFHLREVNHPEVRKIEKIGRAAQIKAQEQAPPFDVETAQLLEWFAGERKTRGL